MALKDLSDRQKEILRDKSGKERVKERADQDRAKQAARRNLSKEEKEEDREDQSDRRTGQAARMQAIGNTVASAPKTAEQEYTSTIEKQMQALEEANRKKALSALNEARSGQYSALSAQEEKVSPLAIQQRAKVGQSAQRSAKDLSSYLATRGLASSGEAERGRGRISAEQVAGQSAITEAEQAQLNAIEQARTGVETGYQADVANVEAGLAATALQNQINLSQQELQRNQQLADLADTRAYNEQQATEQRALQAEELAKQTELSNIAQYSNDYQAEINRRTNNNDPSDDWLIPQLQIARQNKIAGLEQSQQSAQQNAYDQAFDRFNKLGYVANEQDAELLNLPVGSRTATYANQLRDDYRAGVGGTTTTTGDNPQEQYNQFRATLLNSLSTNPSSALQDLQSNRDNIIAVAGRQEYEQLLNTIQSRVQDLAGGRYR